MTTYGSGLMDEIVRELSDELLFALLNNPYESLILIDSKGIVQFMSSATEGLYSVSSREAVGRHISEIGGLESDLTRMLETGKAEIGQIWTIKGKKFVVARIPLKKKGRLIGAAAKLMFHDPDKIKKLYMRIETLEKDLDYYKEELNQIIGIRYSFESIIGNSALIQEAKELANQAAESDSSVIITGESGTGKELFAHSIHRISKRGQQNFVRINCAAIPKDLIEAELFGYEPGAFTGAGRKGKPGKFELADRGTIFLDEIGDMPLNMQVKLMRVLQEKEIERIGGVKPRQIDFRVICATNQDLERMVSKELFRLDLHYRINVITINLPALRDIKEDIPFIFNHLIKKLLLGKKQSPPAVAPDALSALQRYTWPGNVRELRNIAERALIVCRGDRIELKDLPISLREAAGKNFSTTRRISSLKALIEETERQAIVYALETANQNKVKASELLGIHRTGLYQKMKKYGL